MADDAAAAPAATVPAAAAALTHPLIARSLGALYPGAEPPITRYDALLASFARAYPTSSSGPDFVARAPGRVNLIGEHVDYSGFSMLPMALHQQDTLIAARIVDASYEVEISSATPTVYGDTKFSVHEPILVHKDGNRTTSRLSMLDQPSLFVIEPLQPPPALSPSSRGGEPDPGTEWTRYVQAGFKGIFEAEKQRLEDAGGAETPLRFPGMQLLVESSVPTAAGLSSSSSLVCASTLLASYALRRAALTSSGRPAFSLDTPVADAWSKLELASISAHAERFVGTAGGGMDQAISFLSQPGSATKIDFVPQLSCAPVVLPKNVLVLVANSMAKSEKAKTAATRFNKRVLECTLAAHVLAKHLRVCMYAPGYWEKQAEQQPIDPAADEALPRVIPKLTLREVLDASGKSLVEMITLLQQTTTSAPTPAPASASVDYAVADDANEEASATTTPAAAPTAASLRGVPLHAQAYTLPDLHTLFSTQSLKPLLAFRPSLVPSLLEDEYFAHLQQASEGQPEAKVRTRVAFGRSIPTPVVPANDQALKMPSVTKNQLFPWELPAVLESSATQRKKKNESAFDAASDSVGIFDPTAPYRSQGDASLYSPESVASRTVLMRHPLIAKGINRFWILLPHTPNGELHRDEYLTFFMRLCRLFNPDLGFDESWALIKQDWDRDVLRTRNTKAGKSVDLFAPVSPLPVSPAKQLSPGKLSRKEAAAAAREARELAETMSIPYATFVSSLFELVDIWCPDSNAIAYAALLEQVFNKLTVRVESRGGVDPQSVLAAATKAAADSIPTFALYQRALHVYTEALRVEQFAELCAKAAADPSDSSLSIGTVESLGALMCASHVSCARQYECSTHDLDVLVNTCVQKAGAVGARLTGAGWGGCVVALFDTSECPGGDTSTLVTRILDTIIREYYVAHLHMRDHEPTRAQFKDLLFVTVPGSGAAIYAP